MVVRFLDEWHCCKGPAGRGGRGCIGDGEVLAVKGVAKLEAGPVNLGYWVCPGPPPTSTRGAPQRHPRLMHVPDATVELLRALLAIRTTPGAPASCFPSARRAHVQTYRRPARVAPCAISSVQVLLLASTAGSCFLPHTSVHTIHTSSRAWRARTSPWPWALPLSPH